MKIFKKVSIYLLIFATFIIFCGCGGQTTTITESYKLIRVHIRANSNSESDQSVKLKVRDAVTAYLESELGQVKDFETAYKEISARLKSIDEKAKEILEENGFYYGAKSRLCEEFFPTRSYESVIVESGYYDALIIELGDGAGDNWWCVIYPPLCYLEAKAADKVTYKSYIAEIIKKYFTK